MPHTLCTCLWFRDGRGPEAAAFYCSLIPGSRVERSIAFNPGDRSNSVTDFILGGVPFQILDAGPHFTLTEAASISVATDDQAESDRLWAALTADGGQPGMCGWLKDRYGVSWQVYPRRLTDLTLNSDPKVAAAAMAAMMTQGRIDLALIEAAVREALP